ncbi:Uncharacterised protein [Kluyvera intermedia]|nr:hypothetical protein [Kluyvera intermedia]VDZ85352.1 Uncharacterised protein [Kluyvera intermedia]
MADYQEILSMSGIGKTYNEPVLSHINLTLYAGKVLALTGGERRRQKYAV